jgi:hypothetical protein
MSADARRPEQTLIVGGKLRCPRCGTVSDILSYFVFDRPSPYEDELNVVLKCRARVLQNSGKVEPCRCIFSPGPYTEELLSATA